MASRGELLADPRSGAKPLGGGARQGRPPRDQATRDDLARARKRPANTSAQPRAKAAPASRAPARRPRPTSPVGKDAPTAPLPVTGSQDEDLEETPVPDTGNQGRTVNFGAEGSGAFLAFFVYPLVINFLRGGQAQAWGWVKAKWLNEPYGAAAPASTKSGGSANLSAPHNMRRVLR